MRAAVAALVLLASLLAGAGPVAALTAILVPDDVPAIDLTGSFERYAGETDRIQVSTAPGNDGIVRRIEVRASQPGATPEWLVFALTNNSDVQIDRLLVAPHYRMVGSGVLWPDLGAERIAAVTASQGFRPEREASREADVFQLTLDPGSTVTFVVELAADELPQLYLWEPDAYKDSVNNLTLYKGIVLGVAGLLALILTIVVVVKGSLMFPAAAALAWAVLLWLSIDFGFWHKVFDLRAATDGVYRAAAEAFLAATLIVFLVAYLNLNRWHVRFVHIAGAWFACMLALIGIAVVDPEIAAGIARLSLALVAILGFGVVVWLALHGFDRAVMLVPTWLFLVAWTVAGAFAVSGILANDIAAPALTGGIVLIVLLIGFTVMQHAFAGAGLASGLGSDLERRALAITGSGDMVWDWDVSVDRVTVGREFEQMLGLKPGTLQTAPAAWLDILHPADRDRFRAALDAVVSERRGRLAETFRFRAQDGHYVWALLRARPVVAVHGEVTRCVGTLLDVTETRTAEERLLHNAVHDNLTGLPNRELFLDRLESVLTFATPESEYRPSVLLIDLDGYKRVNEAVGLTVGDTILLTIVRRLTRQLKPIDTLARLGGDQFGVILISERTPDRITDLAEQLVKIIRQPVSFGGRDIVLTASIGLALSDPRNPVPRDDLVRNAEVAMLHAKRLGGDHIEIFKPTMRTARTDQLLIEGELRRALERDEIKVMFQPVVRLEDRTIAGFEAQLRWTHPRYGKRPPAEFLAIAEDTGLIVDFGLFALDRSARQLSLWQRKLPIDPPLFVAVNVSARQFKRQDLVQDVKSVLARSLVAPGSLKLEITEGVMMDNPEHAAHMLHKLRELGVGLALDDFGTGHSSLSYLQRFPFDTLKIDRSFVRPQAKGRRPVLLKSIIRLGRDLGLDIVAEGAETDADAIELFQLGCPYAQGMVFGEALTIEEAERLLGITTEASVTTSAKKMVMGALRQ